MFSQFTALAASAANGPVYTVSYANGMLGYIPSAKAYDEGAYEVTWAMLFYNLPRLRKGGLELLAERARRLLAKVPNRRSLELMKRNALAGILRKLREFPGMPCRAKRMECVQLAGAIVSPMAVQKREQAARTPYASRDSVAALPRSC